MASTLKRDLGRDISLMLSWKYREADLLGRPVYIDQRPLMLEQIYVPLSFRFSLNTSETPLYLPKALYDHRQLVVLGDPGCGKSTLVKVIVHSFGRSESTPLRQRFGDLIPMPIILRDHDVRSWQTKEDLLRAFIEALDEEIRTEVTVEWLLGQLQGGSGFLLLDGLDEVGSPSDRLHLRDEIVLPLLKETRKSCAVLTSRVVGYEEAPFDFMLTPPLPGINHDLEAQKIEPFAPLLKRCYVAPFNDEDIDQFITRWYTAREDDPERRREGVESLKVALRQNDRVKRLAGNPSLLTLMALIHRVTAHLPSGRVKLYDKIVEAYLETIDRYRKLSSYSATLEEMKRWLARVGWEMQSRRDSDEKTELLAHESDVSAWMTRAMNEEGRSDAQEEATQFLDYVARRSGLLISRGPGRFTFVHLTFQEYFAAYYLRGQMRAFEQLAETCAKLIARTYWHETLCLLFEMLSEFPGAGNDLLGVIAKASTDPSRRRGAAECLSAVLLDEQNGLSVEKRREAAEFALALACADYNPAIVKNLKMLTAERNASLVMPWFDQQLAESPVDDLGAYFFSVGGQLIADWPSRLGTWIKHRRGDEIDDYHAFAIAAVGARDRTVCEWTASQLPLRIWLQPLDNTSSLELVCARLSDLYVDELYAVSDCSARHRLLAEMSCAASMINSQVLRTVVMMSDGVLAADLTPGLPTDLAEETSALDLHLASVLGRARDVNTRFRVQAQSLAQSLARTLAQVMTLARIADQALDVSDDAAQLVGRAKGMLQDLLARMLYVALAGENYTVSLESDNSKGTVRGTWVFIRAARIFFEPAAPVTTTTSALKDLAQSEDDWTRLVAISGLLMLGSGSPESCSEYNQLLDRGMHNARTFTFPERLTSETDTDEFRAKLPELLRFVFLHAPENAWLRPELFDPDGPASPYLLSTPIEFFMQAAAVLDPKGETDLGKWCEKIASGSPSPAV